MHDFKDSLSKDPADHVQVRQVFENQIQWTKKFILGKLLIPFRIFTLEKKSHLPEEGVEIGYVWKVSYHSFYTSLFEFNLQNEGTADALGDKPKLFVVFCFFLQNKFNWSISVNNSSHLIEIIVAFDLFSIESVAFGVHDDHSIVVVPF